MRNTTAVASKAVRSYNQSSTRRGLLYMHRCANKMPGLFVQLSSNNYTNAKKSRNIESARCQSSIEVRKIPAGLLGAAFALPVALAQRADAVPSLVVSEPTIGALLPILIALSFIILAFLIGLAYFLRKEHCLYLDSYTHFLQGVTRALHKREK